MEEVKSEWLSVSDVAEDIGCDPQSIRVQARTDPRLLGFPVSVIGTRIYIPRIGYEKWKNAGYGK